MNECFLFERQNFVDGEAVLFKEFVFFQLRAKMTSWRQRHHSATRHLSGRRGTNYSRPPLIQTDFTSFINLKIGKRVVDPPENKLHSDVPA